MMVRAEVAHIRMRASAQDEGAFVILLLTIAATLASLVAIVFELGGLKQAPQGQAITQVLLAMATILLSWSFVHTMFTLHYAHEYYGKKGDGNIGGLIFPGDKQPDYRDFLYFSLVIGMTSQVSDVAVTSKVMRRIAAIHGVLSFFFNLTRAGADREHGVEPNLALLSSPPPLAGRVAASACERRWGLVAEILRAPPGSRSPPSPFRGGIRTSHARIW